MTFKFKGMEIENTRVLKPIKMIVYGDNGVGKSYFASCSKNPIFLDLEGNVDHLAIPKQRLNSYSDVLEFLHSLLEQDHSYKTVVIDSLDTLHSFVMEDVTMKHRKEELGYGKDFRFCQNEFTEICKVMDKIRNHKGMNIILIAHARINQFKNPLSTVYDRWETTLNEKVFRILLDWSNCVFFAFKEMGLKEDNYAPGKRQLAYNLPTRWLYTEGNSAYYAKNVYDLPEKIEMDWDILTSAIRESFNGDER